MKKLTLVGLMTFTWVFLLIPFLYAGTLNVCYKAETGQIRILTDTLPNCMSSEIPVTLTTGTGTPQTYTKHCEDFSCYCDNENDRIIKWSYQCNACYNPQAGEWGDAQWAASVMNNGNWFRVVCMNDTDHQYGCDGYGAIIDITCEKQ